MSLDHSQTYKKLTLRNLPHLLRARSIRKTIKKIELPHSPDYFDVGCSNGYLTDQVARLIGAENATGWDHSEENLAKARTLYPKLNFRSIDLNAANSGLDKADFITCLETIEHVGNISEAVTNIDRMAKSNGVILYTVPIESGVLGAIKYLIKKHLFNYTLEEISKDKRIWKEYERHLFGAKDISVFRDQRNGWGTHFGFDYRPFEQLLKQNYETVEAWTSGTTRFLVIKK